MQFTNLSEQPKGKLLESAKNLIGKGLSIIITGQNKKPFVKWAPFQNNAATITEIEKQLSDQRAYGVAVICGVVSGNLEVIDIDLKYDLTGELWPKFYEVVDTNAPGLLERVLIHNTVNNGKHIIYRCAKVEGNQKVAERPTTDEERQANPGDKVRVLIETRGEGGYFIYDAPGYSSDNGVDISSITEPERDILFAAAKYFNQSEDKKPYVPSGTVNFSSRLSPGDDYNQRGDTIADLQRHGYTVINEDAERVYILRPGQTDSNSSGNFHKGLRLFKVFSTSTQFTPEKAYTPFHVFAILECGGNFSEAAKRLRRQGYGETSRTSQIVPGSPDFSISENLTRIVSSLHKVDYRAECGLSESEIKLKVSHYAIKLVEIILQRARELKLELCKNQGAPYLYNGSYWENIIEDDLRKFLGEAARATGIPEFTAKDFGFVEHVLRQFMFEAYMPAPERKNDVLINVQNGTVEIDGNKKKLRGFDAKDFLTHQLPFSYDPNAECPMFQKFLDRVLPDSAMQMILLEYMGYVFVPNKKLKLEKALVCYGDGSNGKSVLFEICEALYGKENMTYHTLTALTDKEGYYRATLVNKLLNYSSEIGDRNDADAFKKLISGEPVSARFPYGRPMTITNYSRFIFNCNKLPKDTEQSHAFFRRFLILPFEVIITEQEQDKQLANKIIASELSGILNLVMTGLDRLILNQAFTHSAKVDQQAKDYRQNSDSVLGFLADQEYVQSEETIPFKIVYTRYKEYCTYGLYSPCSAKTFSERLKKKGIGSVKKREGMHLLIKSQLEPAGFSPTHATPF